MTVQETLKKQLDYCNVTGWRNAGYTGKGVVVWHGESLGGHGTDTQTVLLQVAPDITCLDADSGFVINGDVLVDHNVYVNYQGTRMTMDEFLTKYKPSILTQSTSGSGDNCAEFVQYCKDMVAKHNLKIFNSAANESTDDDMETISTKWAVETCIVVGAVALMNGTTPKWASYSSVGEELDFCEFTSWYSGTSFACPWLSGMTAMIYQRYGVMGFDETYKYLKMISKDLGNAGDDVYYGWGLPILPAVSKKYITMTTKTKDYFIDGIKYTMDTQPINKEGNIFVPLRVVSEALGATIGWVMNTDKTITVTITKGTKVIKITTGSTIAYINGSKYILNFAPYIDANNRTLVPIRFIAEALDCKVDWVQSESKVMILEK